MKKWRILFFSGELLDSFVDFIRLRRTMAACATLGLYALVLWVDYSTGSSLGVALLYVLPIFLMTLLLGALPGVALAFLSTWAWYLLNGPDSRSPFGVDGEEVWAAAIRGGFFLLSASFAKTYLSMREARRLTELKTEVLSIVSHDLNNYASVIQMAVSLLEETDENVPEFRLKAYDALSSNIAKISETVRTFLNMARLESGKFELKTGRILLRDFTKKILSGYDFAVDKKSLTLDLEMTDDAVPVCADPGILTMILGNLLSNAIKYTPEKGSVRVGLRQIDSDFAEISVTDTGVGVPAGEMENIFSGFYRTASGKRMAAGHGLGLKFTREMVVLHGGELKLESAPGKGSRFYFTLPLWKDG